MLTPLSASALNMVWATPVLERMPTPITDTLATLSSRAASSRPIVLLASSTNASARAVERLEKAQAELKFREAKADTNVAKISVIGVGMRSHAGVALKMFETLAAKGINIQVISTSEIKISVLIDAAYTELAVRALHAAYGLDKA